MEVVHDVAADQASAYVLTGNAHWKRATEKERRAVVDAFATNRRVLAVQMSDAFVGEAMGEMVGAAVGSAIGGFSIASMGISANGVVAGLCASTAILTLVIARRLASRHQAKV